MNARRGQEQRPEQLHREDARIRRVTPEQDREFSKTYNKAYADWLQAKQKSDYSAFAPSLKAVRDVELKRVDLMTEKKHITTDNHLQLDQNLFLVI